MKYVKNVDHQISEAKSAIVGVFLGNVALLGWISTIIDFVVLCTPVYIWSMSHLWRNRIADLH